MVPTETREDTSASSASRAEDSDGDTSREISALDFLSDKTRKALVNKYTRLGLSDRQIREATAPLVPFFQEAPTDASIVNHLGPLVEQKLVNAHKTTFGIGIVEHDARLFGKKITPSGPEKRGILFWRQPRTVKQ